MVNKNDYRVYSYGFIGMFISHLVVICPELLQLCESGQSAQLRDPVVGHVQRLHHVRGDTLPLRQNFPQSFRSQDISKMGQKY